MSPTPGPWRIEKGPNGVYRVLANISAPMTIAEVLLGDDAALIAAAPVLYNHLHDLVVAGVHGEYVRARLTLERLTRGT
jgi:hypothetical protein